MKRLISFAVSAALISLSINAACAADIYRINIDSEKNTVTVDGKLDHGQENKIVTLQIINDGKYESLERLKNLSPEDAEDTYFLIAQGKTGAQGIYSFTKPLQTETGKYTVVIGGDGNPAVSSFYYAGDSDIEQYIEEFKKCTSAESVKAYFEASLENHKTDYMGFSREVISGLDNPALVYQNLAVYISKEGLSKERLNSAIAVYRTAAALQRLNETSGAENVKKVFAEFSDVLELESYEAYDTYNDSYFSDTFRDAVDELCGGRDFKTLDEFREYRNTVTVTTALKSLKSWKYAENVLRENMELMPEINFSGYYNLKDGSSVLKAVTNKEFDTLKDVIRTFNEAVETALKSTGNTGTVSGGGGGGGGLSGLTAKPNYGTNISGSNQEQVSDSFGGYKDLAGYDWAEESIAALTAMGVVNGTAPEIFEPSRPVTREEFVKMLILAFEKLDETAECALKDVTADSWYYPYISSAVKSGLVKGVSEDEFGTGEMILREDMAVMLYRFLESEGIRLETGNTHFNDEEAISKYAETAVKALANEGIINGVGNNSFAPKKSAARAEAAKLIYTVQTVMKSR